MTIKKKSIREILKSLSDELDEALGDGDFDLIPGLASRGFMQAGRYLLRTKGTIVRPSWAQLRRHVTQLETITGLANLTEIGDYIRGEEKSCRYADDEWEYDEDELTKSADTVLQFISKVLEMA